MARIRSVKPDYFASEQVASVSYQWRLLFIGLWTHADREGRLLDRPARLKAMLFPYDDLNVDEGLGCLANAGLITRYEGQGLRLISIPTWAKHQQPHIKEAPSSLPPPLDDHEHGARTVLAAQIRKGADQEGKGTVPDALRARFERFWSEYPRRVAKDAAWREFQKCKPDDHLVGLMIDAVRAQTRSAQWSKDGGQYIPHPRTWLHQGRWLDDTDRTEDTRERWVCPHVGRCGNREMCQNATLLHRPERATTEAS